LKKFFRGFSYLEQHFSHRIPTRAINRTRKESSPMGCLVVSVLNESGARQFSAEFPSHKTAKDFVEWRIEELLAQGARYVVVADKDTQTETRYDAAGIANCVFIGIKTGWRYALAREAA
jgi:hypothetical protein